MKKPINPTAYEMRLWNYRGNTPKYTKAEYTATNPIANEMRLWNYDGNTPKYTKAAYNKTNPTADDMRWWNYNNTPKYTDEEINQANVQSMQKWMFVTAQDPKKAKNLISYKAGYQDGYDDGLDEGYKKGYIEAKTKYRQPDFYEPIIKR